MHAIIIVFITSLIPIVELIRPTVKLTFSPNQIYMSRGKQIEIKCEMLHPNEHTESPQLWHIDLKTGKHTSVSRRLLTSPPNDSPDVFKNNQRKRYEYISKNYIRINNLQLEDSAKYECNCPDCIDTISSDSQNLYIMKLSKPKWIIKPTWPLHENTVSQIRCEANDFYPYVSHRIFRNGKNITSDGKVSLSNNDTYSQNFSWVANITPTAEWHGRGLHCHIRQGSSEEHTSKTVQVLFNARFLKCEDQYVDSEKNLSTIECSYSGNPKPELTWLRKIDKQPITPVLGISITVQDENQGKYKSIVTFDRTKLISNRLMKTTTTATIDKNQGDKAVENYYQQLLNNGFIVKLDVNRVNKDERIIRILPDSDRMRVKSSNDSITTSLSSILLSFSLILHITQR